MSAPARNWGGNVEYRATRTERPSSLDELAAVVRSARKLAVAATRHTFNEIGDADVLVDLGALSAPPEVRVDGTVTIRGTTSYTELATTLDAEGRALPNLASLPHVSVTGAIATGTHGSGVTHASLASSVESIELMTATGDIATFSSGDPGFPGAVVHLGALGVVTAVTLRTEPTYDIAQSVFDGLSWTTLLDRFDEVASSGTSVSVFTHYGADPGELWHKQRTDRPLPVDVGTLGLVPADEQRHPIDGEDPASCTAQLGVPGPWWTRLPHFRHDSVPSAGAEIQSEWFVDRTDSAAAIEAVRAVAERIAPALMVGEIRTVAADQFWMSPTHRRDSTALHFTWRPDPSAVQIAVDTIAHALAPFDARVHWGKALPTDTRARGMVEHLDDFLGLKRRLDPDGVFTTPWFERYVLG